MKKQLTIFLIGWVSLAYAQEEVPYKWLQGHWVGDGFGGTSEEVWSAPSTDGTMMGCYRHFKADGSVNFYEFLLLDSAGLRLKHFNPNFEGWEEKEDFLHFKKLEVTKTKVILQGLIYERISDDEMKIYLDMKAKDGKRTEVFTMRRK